MRILFRFVLLPLLALTTLLVALVWFLSEGITGDRHLRGDIASSPVPAAAVAGRAARQAAARHAAEIPEESAPQILFGDLHVHTTYSADAFVFSLPLMQGEGVHPPADACDFARFCAELDFWSINDHAESLTDWQWAETKEAIRECNAVAGDAANPDLVSFLGWEWTQGTPVTLEPGRTFYGHKNVIFRDTSEDRVPARPIGSGKGGLFGQVEIPSAVWALIRAALTIGDFPGNLRPYLDFNAFTRDVRATDLCPEGVAVRDLPPDCIEGAETPELLFAKLDDWDFPSLVIPHGTTWGIHAPPPATLADQLARGMHDPKRQRLFEVYSGHGNSEIWQPLVHVRRDEDGNVTCPAPQGSFTPCCWRAGEIIMTRCIDAAEEVCAARAERARQAYAELWPSNNAERVVPGATPDDWAVCGQLTDSFLPAFHNRPSMSAQYGLAIRPDGAAADEAGAFRYGMLASSDNHKARAGAGYKETARKAFGDAYGFRQDWLDRLGSEPQAIATEPLPASEISAELGFTDPGSERAASYYYTAGLVAAHATGRSREAIWNALEARRVYGTSGPRILLWFDLDNAPNGGTPMGSEVAAFSAAPRFTVRAVGSFAQLPGCPEHTRQRLSAERLDRLCLNECYHPSDERHAIERIEVVRIRPQVTGAEPVDGLIEDPWRTFDCPGGEAGCTVTFEDPDWTGAREHLYYVRALQEPTLAVNGNPMRCERDRYGRCVNPRFCPASGPDFDPDDDCLAPVRERAWSSPIWIVP